MCKICVYVCVYFTLRNRYLEYTYTPLTSTVLPVKDFWQSLVTISDESWYVTDLSKCYKDK